LALLVIQVSSDGQSYGNQADHQVKYVATHYRPRACLHTEQQHIAIRINHGAHR
jgi:hypothetical protein